MKEFFSDFKKFITKGNIVDLAIAVVVGGAFGKIVTSLVNDIIMPLISLATGGVSVKDWKWVIKEAVFENGVQISSENALLYGQFFQTIIDFLIISFFIFLALRLLMQAKTGFEDVRVRVEKLSKKQIKKLRKQNLTDEQIEEVKQKTEQAVVEPVAAPIVTTEQLLTEIRDLLKEDRAGNNNSKNSKQ